MDRARTEDGLQLFLAGDLMVGRDIDQILRFPGDPSLHEPFVKSAKTYVELALGGNGISVPVDFPYVWGAALSEPTRRRPAARIVNLETAITSAIVPASKSIHYKMNPANIPVLTIVQLDACTLASNHILDWSDAGLRDTLSALRRANISTAGAGLTAEAAESPAVIANARNRILLYGVGVASSGIPGTWCATAARPGIWFIPDFSQHSAEHLIRIVNAARRPGDIILLSIHWGPNWDYHISREQRSFAHRIIDEAGVAIIHGHSSHHAKGFEIYRNRLILYGCGNFLNDYEGIRGHESFRGELSSCISQ